MSRVSNEKRKFYSSYHKCGNNYKGECLMKMNVCYKCVNMGHKQRYCPVGTRLGRKRKLRESKKAQIKEGLSLYGSLVSKDRVPMNPQTYYDISSGKL